MLDESVPLTRILPPKVVGAEAKLIVSGVISPNDKVIVPDVVIGEPDTLIPSVPDIATLVTVPVPGNDWNVGNAPAPLEVKTVPEAPSAATL